MTSPPEWPPQPGTGAAGVPVGAPPRVPPGPAYPSTAPKQKLSTRLAERLDRRAEPRLATTLGGTGAVLFVLGTLLFGADRVNDALPSGGNGKTVGTLLSLAVVVIGYGLVVSSRRGPLASAGVILSTLGVPSLLTFLTLDINVEELAVFGGTPVQIDIVAIGSLLAWLVSYLIVPGAQGHGFYLGAFLIILVEYTIDKTEGLLEPGLLSIVAPSDGDLGVDPSIAGAIALTFGVAYAVIQFLLDLSGREGLGTPFAFASAVSLPVGVGLVAGDLKEYGTALVLIVLGAGLAINGAIGGRRFTSWFGGLGIAAGVTVFVAELFDDDLSKIGVAIMAIGAAVVAGGVIVSRGLGEADDMTPGVSRFRP